MLGAGAARLPLWFPTAARDLGELVPACASSSQSRVDAGLMIPGAALQQAAECFGHATRLGAKRGAVGRI
jgi:hypothetical protein